MRTCSIDLGWMTGSGMEKGVLEWGEGRMRKR
jgi:hypothetical protein